MPLVTPTCNSLLVYLLLIHVSLCPISVIVILSRTLIVFVLALPPPFFFVVWVGSFGPYPMLVSRKSGIVFIFSRSMLG